MSGFAVKVTLVGGNKRQQRPNRQQRNNRRRPRQNTRNLGAFLKAPAKVDSEGFTSVKGRRPRRNRAQSPLVAKRSYNVNHFAALDRSPSPPTRQVEGPKVVKTKAPMGAWGAKSAKVVADKPMKPRVSFANDSTNLMKPTAAETREYEKGSASNEFIEYPDEEEYLKLKRSKSAWRSKSADKIKEDAEKAMAILKAQPKMPSYIGAWADAVDSDSEDEEDEVVLSVDSLGRPVTDNSAW